MRFQLDARSLSLVRLADPLRHEVEKSSAVTVREAKIALIVEKADEAKLPEYMLGVRSSGVGQDVWNQRLAMTFGLRQSDSETLTNPENLLFPSQDSSESPETTQKRSPELGEQHSDIPDSDKREKRSPDPRVTVGNTSVGEVFPVPPTIGGEQGNAGNADPGTGLIVLYDGPSGTSKRIQDLDRTARSICHVCGNINTKPARAARVSTGIRRTRSCRSHLGEIRPWRAGHRGAGRRGKLSTARNRSSARGPRSPSSRARGLDHEQARKPRDEALQDLKPRASAPTAPTAHRAGRRPIMSQVRRTPPRTGLTLGWRLHTRGGRLPAVAGRFLAPATPG